MNGFCEYPSVATHVTYLAVIQRNTFRELSPPPLLFATQAQKKNQDNHSTGTLNFVRPGVHRLSIKGNTVNILAFSVSTL